jgi:hypothetical protein
MLVRSILALLIVLVRRLVSCKGLVEILKIEDSPLGLFVEVLCLGLLLGF